MAIGTNAGGRGKDHQSSLKTGTKGGLTSSADGDLKTVSNVFRDLYLSRQAREQEKTSGEKQKTDLTAVWQRYMAGDKDATEQILKGLEPTIRAALNNLVGADQQYLTRARLLALKALKGYDPNQGTALPTFVYNRLQSLHRIAADRRNFIHVPERSALERKQLEAIKQDYILENGIEPSLSMLADMSGMPINKVSRLTSIFGTTSTSATRGEHGDSLEAQKRSATELYNDSFYTELPEIDKKIYEWSTGYKGSPQLDRATMAKKLGMSEAAVSQHATKINKMAAQFDRQLTTTIYGD